MYTNVLEFLENSANKYADKIAVKDNKEEISFIDLMTQSKQTGCALAEYAVIGRVVPVLMEKSVRTLVAFFGIVYAGACYSLMNPALPAARLGNMIKLLDSPVLITDEENKHLAIESGYQGKVVCIEKIIKHKIDDYTLRCIRQSRIDLDPLYVNFTSGSTGTPKGVVVGHRSTIEFISYFTEIFGISSEDIIGNQAPFDFDVSVKDIYSMLYTGATMYIIPKEYFSFPSKLLDVLDDERVTVLTWAVSAMCVISSLKGFEYKKPTTIRKIMFSGEVMPIKHLRIWQSAIPGAKYYNLYGPTEITCNCTYYEVENPYSADTPIPIGKNFPNERIILMDAEGKTVSEVNQEGEICVSGSELALGYFGDIEKTKERFIYNQDSPVKCEMVYKTGDLGYWREDGNLMYVGRKDFQIKHLGHRIELGEIETIIGQMPNIVRVCCQYDNEHDRIVAFTQGDAEKMEIIKHLKERVDKYMIPQKYLVVENMPVTKNGKIDRKKLMEMYYATLN